MENLFFCLFQGIMHMNDVLKTLYDTAGKGIPQLHKCGSTEYLGRLQQYIKLYMTVRIHHGLKVSNIGMTYGHKSTRKML